MAIKDCFGAFFKERNCQVPRIYRVINRGIAKKRQTKNTRKANCEKLYKFLSGFL